MTFSIRPLAETDGLAAGRIFFDAVHQGTADVYSPAQREAWAGARFDPGRWETRLIGVDGFVAEKDQRAIGFMTLDAQGYIDLAFVDPDHMGQGVGRQLYSAIEQEARSRCIAFLTTEASEKAMPFFQKLGWEIKTPQTVIKNGVAISNYRMFKALS